MHKSLLGQQYYGLVECHASKQIMCLWVRIVFFFASMTSSGFVGLVLADDLPHRSEERLHGIPSFKSVTKSKINLSLLHVLHTLSHFIDVLWCHWIQYFSSFFACFLRLFVFSAWSWDVFPGSSQAWGFHAGFPSGFMSTCLGFLGSRKSNEAVSAAWTLQQYVRN